MIVLWISIKAFIYTYIVFIIFSFVALAVKWAVFYTIFFKNYSCTFIYTLVAIFKINCVIKLMIFIWVISIIDSCTVCNIRYANINFIMNNKFGCSWITCSITLVSINYIIFIFRISTISLWILTNSILIFNNIYVSIAFYA